MTTEKCAMCSKEFPREGWVATNKGATIYALTTGTVALCSSECEQAWVTKRSENAT